LLERERQKLSAIVHHADAGFFALDRHLRLTWAAGTHRAETPGRACHEVLCREPGPCEGCPAAATFCSRTVAHHELSLTVAGRTRDLYATAMPLRSPHGEVDEAMVMVQDVSDLEVLRRSNDRTELLLAQMPAILWTTDPDLRFTSSTGAGLVGLGLLRNEAVGLTLFEYFGTGEEIPAIAAHRQALAGRSATFETEWKGRAFQVHVEPLLDGSGTAVGTVGVALDVTERKRAEEALRQSEAALSEREEQLRQSQKMEAIGTLAGGVAHDFNNILTGILGYAALLKRGAAPGDRVHKAAEVIEKAAERGASLTRQLLGFARRGKNQTVAVELGESLREVVALLGRTVDKSILIDLKAPAAPLFTCGDPAQIQQVMLNLAVNARDAMPEGGTLTLGAEALDSACVRLCVRDTGCGIPEENLARIFEPFFTTKERGKGTGMGLAMVYGIVQNHGGSVQVTSRPGEGTLVQVDLPRIEAPVLPADREESACVPVTRGAGSILVVDDEEVVRQATAAFLQELGYRVAVAEDGRAALAHYHHHETDLVLLDLVMPGMGGRECFRALKALDPGVRAVLCSGYGFNIAAQELLDEGVLEFLPKPYALLDLGATVARVLTPRATPRSRSG
ncbi:MAG TPA: ATP-binding protein, partial [Candidatus Polarisedimenticolaceae bacterium]|nr:ATP-binding protein [Candidatus Polarisedimenticolaceae bacterium]